MTGGGGGAAGARNNQNSHLKEFPFFLQGNRRNLGGKDPLSTHLFLVF